VGVKYLYIGIGDSALRQDIFRSKWKWTQENTSEIVTTSLFLKWLDKVFFMLVCLASLQ